MAATNLDGPEIVYGNLANIPAGTVSTAPVPDPNQDAGPSIFYQGTSVPDPRLIFVKDKVVGFTGVVQSFLSMAELESVRTCPAGLSGIAIAAAANVVSGVPMVLTANNATFGVSVNIPVRQFSPVLNSGAIVNALALDFGFAFGQVTAGSTTIPVGNGYDFFVGMPLVIPGAGASATLPLLTIVTAVNQQGNSITVANAPGTGTATVVPIGTGDLWGPNENPLGFPTPQAAYPFLAQGPGLFLDARQSLARGVSITGVAGGSGGIFIVSGLDIYGQPMTEQINATAGATTTFGKKAFKYILSVTPQFSNAFNYSVGTSDVFGFAFRSTLFEDMEIYFAGTYVTVSNTAYNPAVLTQPSTNILGDVRGTAQMGPITTSGPVAGLNANASNGALTGLVFSAASRRLEIVQRISVAQAIQAEQSSPFYLMGVTQA